MSQVGLIGMIALIPFVIKIFFGMLSDRFNFLRLGYRKPYILLGLFVQCLCLVVVPGINPGEQFGLFALLAFVLMSGQALYDTCTDGLALDTTPKEEEGTIQGIMVGGRALGVVLISAALGCHFTECRRGHRFAQRLVFSVARVVAELGPQQGFPVRRTESAIADAGCMDVPRRARAATRVVGDRTDRRRSEPGGAALRQPQDSK